MRKLATTIYLMFVPLSLQANFKPGEKMAWPVKTSQPLQISSTFGESRIDHFHNGIDLPGEGIKIQSPRAGRVIWEYVYEEQSDEMPFGGGSTLIVDHGDSWLGYMHLKEITYKTQSNPVEKKLDGSIEQGTTLGVSGNTGHSAGAHLHFFVYHPQNRLMINPLLLLNEEYYDDHLAPEIKEWGILLTDKFSTVNPGKPFRMSADYPGYVLIQDHGKGRERWGVYDYQLFIDFQPALNVKFDTIQLVNNAWQTSNQKSFEAIYYRNYYALTTQLRKAKTVAIQASDLRGNTVNKTFQLDIQQN